MCVHPNVILSKTDVVTMINQLIVDCDLLIPRITSFRSIDYNKVLPVFEAVTKIKLVKMEAPEDKKYKVLIDTLSSLLDADLSHLNPTLMSERDAKHLYYLLEILTAIRTYLSTAPSSSPSKVIPINHQKIDEKIPSGHSSPPEKCICIQRSSSSTSSSSLASVSLCNECPDLESCSCCSCHKTSCSRMSSASSSLTEGSSSSSSCSISYCQKDTKCLERRQSLNEPKVNRVCKKVPIVLRHDSTPERPKKCKPQVQTRKSLRDSLNDYELRNSDIQTLMSKYKIAKEDAFSIDLGRRLHEALRLEEEAKRIEAQIENYMRHKYHPKDEHHVQQTSGEPFHHRSSSSSVSPVRKRDVNRSLGSFPTTAGRKRVVGRVQHTTGGDNRRSLSSGPVSRGMTHGLRKSSSLESFLSKFSVNSIPVETRKKLKQMEMNHRHMMQNFRDDMRQKESRGCQLLRDAVEKEMKRSDMIRKDIDRLESLKIRRDVELNEYNQKFLKKELRAEKARVGQMVQKYHLDSLSKLKGAQAKQEALIKKEFEKQLMDEKSDFLKMKKDIKQKEDEEYEKKKKFLEAFENMYDQKYQMVKSKLEDEEKQLKLRIQTNSQLLNDVKKQIKSTLNRI